ncbi:hypothetical protein Dimus_010278, partial [Dionaea muscipula]
MRAEDLRVRAWQFRTLQSGQLSSAALENVLHHRQTIAYIRRTSGAILRVQENRVPDEIT